MSAPQYTPDTNNGQLPEDSSSSVPTLDLSELDDYYTDNGEKIYIFYLSRDAKTFSIYFQLYAKILISEKNFFLV